LIPPARDHFISVRIKVLVCCFPCFAIDFAKKICRVAFAMKYQILDIHNELKQVSLRYW